MEREPDQDDPPADEAVVRGGKMSLETLRTAAWTYRARFPEDDFAISGWSYPGASAADSADLFPTNHRHFCGTTAGALRDAGFPVHRTGRYGHVTIKLPDGISDENLERLRESFSEPRIRPKFED